MRGKTIRKGNSWVIVRVRVRALAVECDEKAFWVMGLFSVSIA